MSPFSRGDARSPEVQGAAKGLLLLPGKFRSDDSPSPDEPPRLQGMVGRGQSRRYRLRPAQRKAPGSGTAVVRGGKSALSCRAQGAQNPRLALPLKIREPSARLTVRRW